MGLNISNLTGLDSAFSFAQTLANKILPDKASEEDKLKIAAQLQNDIESRDSQLSATLLETQKDIIVSEMQQTDNYTKRARPTIVYFGLVAIGLVYVIVPLIIAVVSLFTQVTPDQIKLFSFQLPGDFWATWGGVCGVWIAGRSFEKAGSTNSAVQLITGNKKANK